MGAVSFSLDQNLITTLKKIFKFSYFIETGTYKGDTTAVALEDFEKIISIELSPDLCIAASKRFEQQKNVLILQGNSADHLANLKSLLSNVSTLYWLDAHWCIANHTSGEHSQCPLLDEIDAIGALNSESVLLIDDARLFMAPPLAPHDIDHWPSLTQLLQAVRALSSDHEIMVLNDVIIVFPPVAAATLRDFAHSSGFDWLSAARAIKENWYAQLVDKEAFVQRQAIETSRLTAELERHRLQVKRQSRLLRVYRLVYSRYSPRHLVLSVLRRTKALFWPRLGILNQYPPRPLTPIVPAPANPLKVYPTISITTPSFQQGHFLERTITSVLDQQYPNLEYFVQDGGSTDHTIEILEKYSARLSGWVSEADGGQSQAINLGLSRTSGEIMAWLNSDDLLLPHALETVARYFVEHPDIDVIYGDRLLIDTYDMEIGRWMLGAYDDNALSFADFIPQETLFWRRQMWEKAGGKIDESFRFAMDWDLLIRFRDAGARFAHIPQFLGAFRIHDEQKTQALIEEVGTAEMNRIRQRTLGRIPSREEIRSAITRLLVTNALIDLTYRMKIKIRATVRRVKAACTPTRPQKDD